MAPRDDWNAAAGANARQLESGLDSLRQHLRMNNYKGFWADVKSVSASFKTLKPLIPDDHRGLWSTLDTLCQQAKADQERTGKQRQNVSRQKRDLVIRKMDGAHWQAKSATSSEALKAAGAILSEAMRWMKPGWSQVSLGDSVVHQSDGRMLSDDHNACWERSQEVRETIDWKWKEFKDAWGRKQNEWRAKQQEFRSRLVHNIDKARTIIRSLEGQIDNCHDQQRSARTSEHEYRIQGWIDEKRNKIRDIEGSISRDEAKLAEVDRKLRE